MSAPAQSNDAEKNIEIWKVLSANPVPYRALYATLADRYLCPLGQEADQETRSCPWKRYQHDLTDYSYVTSPCAYERCFFEVRLTVYPLSTAPKDQISRAAKMLAEEYV